MTATVGGVSDAGATSQDSGPCTPATDLAMVEPVELSRRRGPLMPTA